MHCMCYQDNFPLENIPKEMGSRCHNKDLKFCVSCPAIPGPTGATGATGPTGATGGTGATGPAIEDVSFALSLVSLGPTGGILTVTLGPGDTIVLGEIPGSLWGTTTPAEYQTPPGIVGFDGLFTVPTTGKYSLDAIVAFDITAELALSLTGGAPLLRMITGSGTTLVSERITTQTVTVGPAQIGIAATDLVIPLSKDAFLEAGDTVRIEIFNDTIVNITVLDILTLLPPNSPTVWSAHLFVATPPV